jgi:hypothetical protein
MLTRRQWLRLSLTGTAVAVATGAVPAALAAEPTPITVYKTPTCGCCTKWADHLRANGFKVTTRDMNDLSEVKSTFGVPERLQSCHTATVNGVVVEGHVPADVLKKFLRERPANMTGLAVPGMPVGSPGMEGGTPERYDIIAFDRNGKTSVYASR